MTSVQPNVLLALAGLIGAALVGGAALLVAVSGSSGATAEGPAAVSLDVTATREPDPGGQIVVDVSGAVVRPGLQRLPAGARVGDAIDAAGGFSPRVDAARVGAELNLAATLADGDQVRVPSRDDPVPTGGGSAGGASAGGGAAGGGPIDLNSASQAQLEELPGIGPVTAGKIITAREEARFGSVDELRTRGVVGEKTFEKIRALITVR